MAHLNNLYFHVFLKGQDHLKVKANAAQYQGQKSIFGPSGNCFSDFVLGGWNNFNWKAW